MDSEPTREPIKVVGDLLASELALPAGQIMLGLENWRIPKNEDLYIALFYGVEQVIGNDNYQDMSTDPPTEIQCVAMLHEIVADIMSFGPAARTRKEEVLQAFASYAAQELMEKYQMRFASIPTSFSSVPGLEPAKQLNRFRLTVAVNALHRKVKAVPYYTQFPTEVIENA